MTPSEHLAKFHDTVAILVKAYLNDTLQHGNDCACAIGNLIAFKRGYDVHNWNPQWFNAYVCRFGNREMAKEEIRAIGYSVKEVLSIERAFEEALPWDDTELRIFNGLMACVTVLASIHGVDLETTEAARKLLVKV